jgi:predicted ATP-grasp superfamily ATP-dependent carboligase
MREYAVRLMGHLKWNGVAMVEFKVDKLIGSPMLMEINGRFWGSLQLALDAGLNLPYLLVQMVNGVRLDVADHPYRVGTKSRWLLGDLDHLLIRLTKSDEKLHLDADAPSRWRCLARFLKMYEADLHYEVERVTDPGPAWQEYRSWMKGLLKSLGGC